MSTYNYDSGRWGRPLQMLNFWWRGRRKLKKNVTFVFVLSCYAHIFTIGFVTQYIKKINFWPRMVLFDQQQ